METITEYNIGQIGTRGYLDIIPDPSLNLFEEIEKLKKEKNAVVLAHYYQEPDIQDIADYIGDSLGLAQEAAKTGAGIIAFAGVHFMAETAKILCPEKKVVLPDLRAGCSLADSCPVDPFREFRKSNPGHIVITYVNSTAEIKALSDIVCTSTNAAAIIESLPPDQPVIFAPDKNLGKWLQKKTGREMKIWDGACMVHELFSTDKIVRLKEMHPGAKFIAHPECESHVLELADYIGSTTGLLNYTVKDPCTTFVVATESGILHQMRKSSPLKTFIPAPPDNACACNDCPHMKLNTLEKLYLCLAYEKPEIVMEESLRKQAEVPIRRMLEISRKLGL